MSTFSNENHVTRGFTSDAINEFAFRLHVLINISGKLYHLIHSEFEWNNISDYYTEMNINNCVFWHIQVNMQNKKSTPSPQIGLKWQTSQYLTDHPLDLKFWVFSYFYESIKYLLTLYEIYKRLRRMSYTGRPRVHAKPIIFLHLCRRQDIYIYMRSRPWWILHYVASVSSHLANILYYI